MKATEEATARLATHRIRPPLDREVIGRGYRATALAARLSTESARLFALQRLCAGAERKPAWLYNVQRAEPRASLPCERLDAAILEGIRVGYITPEVLADYFGDLFALYRAMMPDAHATYLDTAREKSEALEAISIARAVPTPENIDRAARELMEDAIVSTAHAKTLQRGAA